jgi:hypothetical protein
MNSDRKETSQTPGKDTEIEKAKLLWDEYKYRHEHCWKLVFQITAAVVIISIIPYIKVDIATSLRYWIVSLPALGTVLTLFSMCRLRRELHILGKITRRHRELQRDLQGIEHVESHSTFSRDVQLYFGVLTIVGAINIIVIVLVWIPHFQ